MGADLSIERVDAAELTPESFVARYQRTSTPVVVTGLFEGMEEWSPAPLLATLGERVFRVRFYGADKFAQDKSRWRQYSTDRDVSFRAYAEMLRDGSALRERAYMGQVPLTGTPLDGPPLSSLASRLGLEPRSPLNLWCGPAGHTEPLHHDTHDGTLVQLYGEKRVALFSPAESRNLYPFGFFNRAIGFRFSRVYIDRPDFVAFPRLAKALRSKRVATLGPGEVLFIPARWWHEVSSLGEQMVCSVNRFWRVVPWHRTAKTRLLARAHLEYLKRFPERG